MYCNQCGTELAGDSLVCEKCGRAAPRANRGHDVVTTRNQSASVPQKLVLAWVFAPLLFILLLWIITPSKTYNGPSPSQTSPPASTKTGTHAGEEVPTQAESKSVPAVQRKLYIDSPDMEEIIEANLRLQAADYGFELVPVRSQADVVLEGSAGVLKQDGLLGACVPFYGFDVVRQGPRHGKESSFKLESGIPNDLPCIRLSVAKRILYDLRERLDALDSESARQ